jgi:hypothetical protein
MTVAPGTLEYSLGAAPVTGCGISWTADELNAALAGPVAEVIFDDAGKADLAAVLAGLSETEFDQTTIRDVLAVSRAPEDWRVGEALAESYLVQHRKCHFPWPDGRDERKSGSSLPGADLVGFQNDGETDRFAFGEVKTSSEKQYPPGAMHGHKGLKQQLEDLRDKEPIRRDLVKYLGYRATNASWKDQFERAVSRYLTNSNDVRVFGLMVRDVPPHEDDLRIRVSSLGRNCSEAMIIELMAMYLPLGSIATLSEKVLTFRQGGKA